MSLSKTGIASVTTAAALALLGFAAPDLAGAQTRPTFERKYIGTWCRVSSEPEGATLRREPRGKICSPERRVVITATEVHGMFAPWEYVYPAPTEAIKVVGEFEMMHCKVQQYLVNMNGMAWVWFACSNGEHLRGVFLIDGRELATSREMLREKPSAPVAAAAEVPAQYRGLWCEARDGSYYRCRKATDEGYQHIHRDRIKLSEEGDCPVTAVTRSAKGHRLSVNCPPEVLPDPPEHVNLRLDARGRLHLDSTEAKAASTEAEATGWEYDWRRCMVGRNVGNFSFRFLSSYGPPYVIDFNITKDDQPDFKVGSVWLGRASWVPDDGKLGSRSEVLPHLRQGNTLVVYSTDGASILQWKIEGGDKAVKFLIDCPRYWERGRRKRR